MAKHSTVFGVNRMLIPGRLDDNFGLTTTTPSVVATTTGVLSIDALTTNFVMLPTGAVVTSITGGKIGQSLVIGLGSSGSATVTTVSSGTGVILDSTSGTLTLNNLNKNITVLKTTSSTWVVTALNFTRST